MPIKKMDVANPAVGTNNVNGTLVFTDGGASAEVLLLQFSANMPPANGVVVSVTLPSNTWSVTDPGGATWAPSAPGSNVWVLTATVINGRKSIASLYRNPAGVVVGAPVNIIERPPS